MSDRKNDFLKAAEALGLTVYPPSVDEAEGTVCAIVRTEDGKCLAALGEKASAFAGTDRGRLRLCPLSTENAAVLTALFPYLAPRSHRGHAFTFGLGDRLGLATPGHLRAIAGFEAFPVLAQQSIRELNLTGRSFPDVIAAAAFGAMQAGHRSGYGADGDHLKTHAEIRYALESGCSMITLDCSEHIDTGASALGEAAAGEAYAALPESLRRHYETEYLGKDLPVVGPLSEGELRRIVLTFHRAIRHAADCWQLIRETSGEADFELSIDETSTVTTPAEHLVIAMELARAGVRPDSVAPHFSGTFEKGVEYVGDLAAFTRDLTAHQEIAGRFGYKLSLHSGSDKFSVFPAVGRITGGRVHVKTAGTSWLEALAVLAERDPALFRRTLACAMERRPEAEKYYHVSTKVREIPDPAEKKDGALPEYLLLPASRQTLHIAYGLLLAEPWFREPFFRLLDRREEDYAARLEAHIGKHLRLLTPEKG